MVAIKKYLKEYSLLVLGCFIFSAGAVMFVEPYGFAPGGTYGLSMVFHHLWGWRTEVTALCMDIPLLIIGILVIGRKFGVKTLICTLLLPAFMWLMHTIYGYNSLIEPDVTDISLFDNQILAAIFGAIVYGVGLGLIFKSRATSGGSDILAMIVNKYFHLPLGTCIIIVDGIITLSTVIAFKDWTLPMYSWIIIYVESKVIDFIVDGAPSKTMMIITNNVDEVKDIIINELGRGATLIPARGMFQGVDRDILYVVLTRKEMISLRYKIADIDPRAFINVIDSSEILGEGFKNIKE
ncbi:MAG: YitT family protein [Bacteroidales bacterium]|nr:YitT family protein [Bacteroidales bacterium]